VHSIKIAESLDLKSSPLTPHFREVYHRPRPEGAAAALEKVCHFVGTTFVCFQRVMREIALHGVSLNLRLVIGVWPRGVQDRRSANNSFVLAVRVCSAEVARAQTHSDTPLACPQCRQECLCHSNRITNREIGALEVRTAYSVVKERYAARPEQAGHRCAQQRGGRKPRLTLIHISTSVYCGNYVERKELKPCELWRW